MSVILMDCTLRDGANVVGKGFSAEITDMVLDGLTACHVPIIEFGNAGGIGAYEVAGFTNAETDQTYLDIAQKYLDRGSQLGMFLNAKRYREKNVALAKESGLSFLRVGADAGDDEITIMDSAGTMLPGQVAEYTKKLTRAVSIPVAFHCHNNLGLSAANAVAAYENGAAILDCGLMGMARSAGNLATEMCVAIMQRMGEMKDVDLYGMLDFIDSRLQPAMDAHQYHNPVTPLDLVLGISGCHSSFLKKFRTAAREHQVNLYRLIVEVSAVDQKAPSDELIAKTAAALK